jgi:hypothetical protein
MSEYYVRSGATGAADGSIWADAFTNIAAALAVAGSGDTLWVANDHLYAHGASYLVFGPDTGVGVRILGVNTNSVEPPTGLADPPTATEAVGSANAGLAIAGRLFIDSMIFLSSTSSSGGALFTFGSTISCNVHCVRCKLQSWTANSFGGFLLGFGPSTANDDSLTIFDDCSFYSNNTTRMFAVQHGRTLIRNCTIDPDSVTPTQLIMQRAGVAGELIIDASDVSGEAFSYFMDPAGAGSSRVFARNLKMPSGTAAATGSANGPGGPVIALHNTASGDVYNNMARAEHAGTQVEETTLVRTGGSDVSYRIDTSANAAYPNVPFTSSEGAMYNSVTTEQTLTVEILHDTNVAAGQGSGTDFDFTNAEVYLRVMALTTSGFPLGEWVSDAPADVFATPTDQDASSEAWTTTGMTTPVKQALSVTFTAAEAGYLHWEVCVAAASKTLYADLSSPTLS